MTKVLWTQKQDIGPRARAGHAMVFDSGRQRVLFFGGDFLDNWMAGDTWEWDGENWTQVQDIGPSPRAYHAMAHDSARARTVLFGGMTPSGGRDTWEWDGESWTQVADTGPAKRWGHSMAFDSNRKRVVLFGGESDTGVFGDTWEWDGNNWVQQEDTGPSARRNASMAYDSARGRAVLFGGVAPPGYAGLGDTWEWNGTAWTQEADFGPAPSAAGAMIFNGTAVVLFGGVGALISSMPEPPVFGLSWEWDGKHWTARQDMGPGPRNLHAMAFDSARSRTVLFGGLHDPAFVTNAAQRLLGDTWEQVGAAATTGGGGQPPPTGPLVQIASVSASPNPVPAGQTTVVTVTLVAPAPAATSVTLSVVGPDHSLIGTLTQTIPIAAGATNVVTNLTLPTVFVGAVIPLPLIVTVSSGPSQSLTTLIVV